MRVVRALLEEYVEPYELSDAGVNFIVARVMAIYGFSIFVWLLCLAYHGISLNEDVFDSIAESIKVAVVPVVTFAIGYFFARERGREGICFEEFERAGSLGSVEVKEEATDPSAIARKEFDAPDRSDPWKLRKRQPTLLLSPGNAEGPRGLNKYRVFITGET